MRLTPIHCPGENDVQLDLGDEPVCSPGHPEQRAALQAATQWLGACADALGNGSLLDAECPHPDGSGKHLRFSGIDPECLAVVLAQGQAGRFHADDVEDADAVYLGLCAQQPSGRWQGLAGVFVWLCANCGEPDDPLGTRDIQTRLAALPDLRPWNPRDIPAELAWGPGWWEERWVATFGLATRLEDLWQVLPLRQALAGLAEGEAALLRIGEQWGPKSSIIFVTAAAAVSVGVLLGEEFGTAEMRARRGASPDLIKLLGSHSATASEKRRLNMRQGPPPAEPVLIKLTAGDGSSLVRFTHQPRLVAQQLAADGRIEPPNSLEVWSLPRWGSDGAIDGEALCALHQKLTTPLNGQ